MAERIPLTREFLYREYVELRKTGKQIADETGWSKQTIYSRARKFGFPLMTEKPGEKLNEQLLRSMYLEQGMSVREIRLALDIKSSNTIRRQLKKFGITRGRVRTESMRQRAKKQYRGYRDISGSYWCRVRHGAKARGLPLEITMEDAWVQWERQGGRCALTGVEIKLVAKRQRLLDGDEEQTASLDRIDSDLGYIHGNIQWVHKKLQKMKLDTPNADFIYWCKLVADNHKDDEVACLVP